jgi:phosphoribosylformimino-5-aminoimidazole carboxamide ribotide isomerase
MGFDTQMYILPAIDLKDGRCVRLSQGRKAEAKIYDADPLEVARAFASSGADMIHIVDLDGAFSGGECSNRAIVKKIVNSVNVPVEFGGGIRAAADVRQLLGEGVAQVILGTIAAESTETLRQLVEEFGSRVCVGIDARDGRVMTRGWESTGGSRAVELARAVATLGVERIIYTDIRRDGMLNGPNVEQTCEVARAAQVRVTASGGVSCLDDIKRLREANEALVDSVIVGKALYEGRFTLEEALRVADGEVSSETDD